MAVSLEKVVLEKTGSESKLNLSKGTNNSKVDVKLSWTKGVDLDLHAFYAEKGGLTGHIFYGNKFATGIKLDQDSGVGNKAGDNEENLVVKDLSKFDYVLFAVNIFKFLGAFSKGENFAKYDGKILFSADTAKIEVPLNSEEKGKWAVIALVDNKSGEAKVKNINKILSKKPSLKDYI